MIWLVLLALLVATPAWAQPLPIPDAPTVVVGSASLTVPVTISYPPSPTPNVTYEVTGAYNDGTGRFDVTASTLSVLQQMPLPPSTIGAWTCVAVVSGATLSANRCAPFTVTPVTTVYPGPVAPPTAARVNVAVWTLLWTDSAPNNGAVFDIERAPSSSGPWVPLVSVTESVTTYEDRAPLTGKNCYHVRERKDPDVSAWSPFVCSP